MDYDHEIRSLAAETLALQQIVKDLCAGLAMHDPSLAPVIAKAFDNAARALEDYAIFMGKAAHPEHGVKAIRIVEELRAAVLGSPGKPKGGI